MKKKIIPLLLASSALIVGCNEKQTTDNGSATSSSSSAVTTSAPAVNKEDAVAVVNGTYISKSALETLEAEIAQRSHGQKFPKEQLLEELIQRELLVQDAKQKKLDQSAEVQERIQMATRSLLSQAALQDYLKANPVSDDELKVEYEKEVAQMSGDEYKARHILLKEEAEAKKLIAELEKDASKFADLAKEHSTGPSGPQGGDLGWFVEGQMVEPFSKAVVALENGQFTKEPVKTQFGWHVILREDSRKQTPPPFDAIKEQLRPAMQQQKIQQMLDNLRKAGNVEILVSLEEPKTEDASKETIEEQAQAIDAAEEADANPKEEATTEAPQTEESEDSVTEEMLQTDDATDASTSEESTEAVTEETPQAEEATVSETDEATEAPQTEESTEEPSTTNQ